MIDMGLRGRVALVSGATQGVGRAAAQLFAAEGTWIAVNYRTDVHGAKALVDAIRSAGGRALLAPADLRTRAGAWTMARYIEHEWAQIDILLHTAPLLGPDEAAPDATPLLAELAPGMRERGWGRVTLFRPSSMADPGCDPDQWQAAAILANVICLPAGERRAGLDEAAARAALFLGSGWNRCVTGMTFTISPKAGG
jgi:NAD(P)-dependent dehydrogenase (short-subunit alcohol dehydrogenase family)